jgi:hypothetical protein
LGRTTPARSRSTPSHPLPAPTKGRCSPRRVVVGSDRAYHQPSGYGSNKHPLGSHQTLHHDLPVKAGDPAVHPQRRKPHHLCHTPSPQISRFGNGGY